MDDYAKEYVENTLSRANAILSSGEFMYRKLRAEFIAQECAIRELMKCQTSERDVLSAP